MHVLAGVDFDGVWIGIVFSLIEFDYFPFFLLHFLRDYLLNLMELRMMRG